MEQIDFTFEKTEFLRKLKGFSLTLNNFVSTNENWNIKGFIDLSKNIYTISTDSKVVSKIMELHIFPKVIEFAKNNDFKIELAECQNWYPDLTFISTKDERIKFAVDLKTTYRDEKHEGFCNGFTLGSHGEYFTNRKSKKNIQYPYEDYLAHICLGVIYSRNLSEKIDETKIYSIDDLQKIPSVIKDFIFFAEEKWKIASDKGGSGNTANIGSIQKIDDILNGNGVFSKAGEKYFDEYWINFGNIKNSNGKKITSFKDYLKFRNLPETLYNEKESKRKLKKIGGRK